MGPDGSVGVTTNYGLDDLGIESLRCQWPHCLRSGLVSARLTGLRVRIPAGVIDVSNVCRTVKKTK